MYNIVMTEVMNGGHIESLQEDRNHYSIIKTFLSNSGEDMITVTLTNQRLPSSSQRLEKP